MLTRQKLSPRNAYICRVFKWLSDKQTCLFSISNFFAFLLFVWLLVDLVIVFFKQMTNRFELPSNFNESSVLLIYRFIFRLMNQLDLIVKLNHFYNRDNYGVCKKELLSWESEELTTTTTKSNFWNNRNSFSKI